MQQALYFQWMAEDRFYCLINLFRGSFNVCISQKATRLLLLCQDHILHEDNQAFTTCQDHMVNDMWQIFDVSHEALLHTNGISHEGFDEQLQKHLTMISCE